MPPSEPILFASTIDVFQLQMHIRFGQRLMFGETYCMLMANAIRGFVC